jgi:hypothetical protein
MEIKPQPELATFSSHDICSLIKMELEKQGYYVLKFPTVPQIVVEVTNEKPDTDKYG